MTEGVHQPVLLAEVAGLLAPCPGGVYVDCTVGPGGHAETLLGQSSPDGRLIGFDRDREDPIFWSETALPITRSGKGSFSPSGVPSSVVRG